MSIKTKILDAMRNSQDAAFCKKCIENGCAFDVVVDGVKYEIRPLSCWSTYNYGGEAYARGMYESDMPMFTPEEMMKLVLNK